jgi:hypothetical protein
MTLNLHFLHKINILKIEPSLINHQLKGKKRSLQSWSFTPCFVESGTNILCKQQYIVHLAVNNVNYQECNQQSHKSGFNIYWSC